QRFATAVALGLALLASAPVRAQAPLEEPPPGVSPEDDARARELFIVGDELYAQGRYDEAIAAFEEAYELSPRPLLLFNLANAQERAGRWEAARASLERYLPDAPARERGAVEMRITSLERRIERLERLRDEGDAPDPEVVAPAEPEPEPDPEPAERRRSAPGLALTLAGGAVLATGAVLGGLALGARGNVDDACQDVEGAGRLCPSSVRSDADRDRAFSISADVLMGAGAATLAVGLYLLLRKDDDADDDPVTPAASAGREGAWLGLRGRF
ncbi:MAG: tetratricopeptide repeat protein, partial [Myxococcota bacterium]